MSFNLIMNKTHLSSPDCHQKRSENHVIIIDEPINYSEYGLK